MGNLFSRPGMCQTCSILYRIYWGRGVEGGVSGGSLTGRGGYLDNFCHFRPECFDCLPLKIVSYELFRCGKMISEAVRIFYLKKWIFAAGG